MTGQGSTIAIIDTGIDTDSPEFAGRLHVDSRYVAGTGSAEAVDDHGTNVALIAAAARDNTGVVGIAFDATILALRADEPGSCNTQTDEDLDGCLFNDNDIAEGVDQAIQSGATVINLSLGGSAPSRNLRAAIARAAAAGLVIVVAAGNDGDSTEDGIDPDQPDPFASGLLAAGGANVIIVGSIDDANGISDFSNRAGSSAASYLSARGERICCVYEDGELQITTNEDGERFVTLFSGTSFAAPQVAGAAALLAQAFPNLTGDEIVEILLDSARDVGAAGADSTFGRGVLDIARAVAPSGTTTLAGTRSVVAATDTSGTASTAMGDALANATLATVITDKYDRAYSYDLGRRFQQAAAQQKLRGAVETSGRRVRGGNEAVSLAFTVGDVGPNAPTAQLRLSPIQAEQARVLAARIALKIAPDTQAAFGFSESAQGLVGQLQGQDRPAFLIAGNAAGDSGFARSSDASVAIRHKVGPWGLTASGESGDAYLGNFSRVRALGIGEQDNRPFRSFSVTADRTFGDLQTAMGLTWMQETGTVLGGTFHNSIGASGANSLFLDARAGFAPAKNWHIGGAVRGGVTKPQASGLVSDGSDFQSMAWSIDVTRRGVFAPSDSIGLRLSQPLRVESGGLLLNLPVAYDYTTESAIFGNRFLSLAPTGREVMGELAWNGRMFGGFMSASAFYRRQPGHISVSPDDAGVAVKWGRNF